MIYIKLKFFWLFDWIKLEDKNIRKAGFPELTAGTLGQQCRSR
jgi:hypothetical protein